MLPSVEKDKIHCCRLVRVHGFPFKEANTASDRSGVSGVHQWSAMLPTSARVAQEVYEPLIGIQYPMLCGLKNGQSTGLRFVQWMHHDSREAARADPPPEATGAVYRQIEHWLPVEDEERDNILVLTTRKDSAQSLRSFCQQSRRRTNETAVKVAGAIFLHEWRRCVHRLCTSHLSRVNRELPARLRPNRERKKHKQAPKHAKPNKHPKTTGKGATCRVTRSAMKA